jgi:hypothetical protein
MIASLIIGVFTIIIGVINFYLMWRWRDDY